MGTRERVDTARIGEVDLSPVETVSPETKVEDVVAGMQRRGIGSVLVVENGRLVGIFTERDFFRRILAAGHLDAPRDPISKWMTPNPQTIRLDATIGEAIRRMDKGGYRHLPVVDESGNPSAMISVRNIVNWLVEHYPTSVLNLPPDPAIMALEREGA